MKVVLALAISFGISNPSSQCHAQEDKYAIALEKALEYLIRTVAARDWSEADETFGNDLVKRQVVVILTAYLLQVHEDGTIDSKTRDAIIQQAETIIENPGVGFETWKEGFAAIYLFETSLKNGSPHRLLESNVKRMIDLQNPEGGWSHSHGKMVSFYPTTVLAAANLALISLGAANHFGILKDDLDFQDAVEESVSLYIDVQSASGAFPYGGRMYKKGFQSGRTAGALTGLVSLGQGESDLFRNAARYCQKNVETIPYGHASPALHVCLGGLAMNILSDKSWQKYRQGPLARIVSLQQADGSFNDIAGTSPDSMSLGSNAKVDAAYRTVLYTVALSASHSQIARTLRKKVKLRQSTATSNVFETLEASKQIALGKVRSIATVGKTAYTITTDNKLVAIDVAARKILKQVSVELSGQVEIHSVANHIFVIEEVTPEVGREETIGGFVERHKRDESRIADPTADTRGQLVCIDPETLKEKWRVPAVSIITKLYSMAGTPAVLRRNGTVAKFDLEDGKQLKSFIGHRGIANLGGAVSPKDTFAAFGESELKVFDLEGALRWKKRTRAKRGLTKPAFCVTRFSDNYLFAGSTDGLVQCFSSDSGERIWSAKLEGVIEKLLVPQEQEGAVVAFSGSGMAAMIRDGQPVWQTDVVQSNERFVETEIERPYGRCQIVGRHIVAEISSIPHLLVISMKGGAILARIPASINNNAWTAIGNEVITAGDDGLLVYQLPN